jgi:signal transduction histidine kinase
VILASFAVIVGVLTDRELRGQFDNASRVAADQLGNELDNHLHLLSGLILDCEHAPVQLSDYASAEHAQIRIFYGGTVMCTQDLQRRRVKLKGTTDLAGTPNFPAPDKGDLSYQQFGYRVEARTLHLIVTEAIGPKLKTVHKKLSAQAQMLYARPLSDLDRTVARVQFFLVLGVLGGTALALLAGLATAQRAMRPVVELTKAARAVERTRDPSRRLPHPEADDEVADLARTLEDMLAALDSARNQTEATLARQREFVADASHELRTPLTSVLANLELLAEELDGEQADSAHAALRATKRMRRLVGDLLLLARADAKRAPQQRPTDLAEIMTEAAAELGPLAEAHDLSIHVEPAVVPGMRDDLYRMVLNLLENAVQHTPPGTHIRAGTISDGTTARVVVEDDGPGIDPAIQLRVFERFVRGAGDGGRGSGLGLAIVRAVAESHGGGVILARPRGGRGTRFEIRIPQRAAVMGEEPQRASVRNGRHGRRQTSTTTGSTIGRRRNRS